MSLSDCSECWSTPCECGREYKSWSVKRLEKLIALLQNILNKKIKK